MVLREVGREQELRETGRNTAERDGFRSLTVLMVIQLLSKPAQAESVISIAEAQNMVPLSLSQGALQPVS